MVNQILATRDLTALRKPVCVNVSDPRIGSDLIGGKFVVVIDSNKSELTVAKNNKRCPWIAVSSLAMGSVSADARFRRP